MNTTPERPFYASSSRGRNGRRLWMPRLALAVASLVWLLGAGAAYPATATKPAQSAPIVLGDSCMTSQCHNDLSKAKFLHGPVNLSQCAPCHVPIAGKHEFKKTAKTRELCLTCHESKPRQKVVHPPFEADCALCHQPHGSDNRYFVKGGLGAEGCNKCHTDVRQGLARLHGPVAQGECLACHSPHQSDNPKLLTDPPGELCMACHVDFQATMKGAVSVHAPARDNCSGCHVPHGGADQYFVKAKGRDLCMSCHAEFLKKVDSFKHPHIPMAEGKSCENCHSPHASSQEHLLDKSDSELCLSCHDKPMEGSKGRQLPSIQQQIANAKYLHGPVQQKNCSACHDAHGSNFANILDKAFPAGFYEPFKDDAYNLCFDCHDRKIVQAKQGKDTGFRNGDVNLHFLHVNQEKGRSCRACHHEHASDQPKHIRSEVPFGRWSMRIEYTKTDTGGGCSTGCHVPYKYNRENPVQNKTAANS